MYKEYKYGVIGSTGRLGSEVVKVFNEAGHNLVFECNSTAEVKKDPPQILIDCSLPEVFEKSSNYAMQFKVPFIIASTGLTAQQLNFIKQLSEEIPIVQSYNFSIGLQVLLKLTEMAKEKLNGWDIEITETHHRFKKDKPSGTAKMIENIFNDKQINISSHRLGDVPGDHTIHFGGLGEVLSISHRALSRRTFAEGILRSAGFILNKENGFYSFTDVVFSKY